MHACVSNSYPFTIIIDISSLRNEVSGLEVSRQLFIEYVDMRQVKVQLKDSETNQTMSNTVMGPYQLSTVMGLCTVMGPYQLSTVMGLC